MKKHRTKYSVRLECPCCMNKFSKQMLAGQDYDAMCPHCGRIVTYTLLKGKVLRDGYSEQCL